MHPVYGSERFEQKRLRRETHRSFWRLRLDDRFHVTERNIKGVVMRAMARAQGMDARIPAEDRQ
jgi:hypothetical protein